LFTGDVGERGMAALVFSRSDAVSADEICLDTQARVMPVGVAACHLTTHGSPCGRRADSPNGTVILWMPNSQVAARPHIDHDLGRIAPIDPPAAAATE